MPQCLYCGKIFASHLAMDDHKDEAHPLETQSAKKQAEDIAREFAKNASDNPYFAVDYADGNKVTFKARPDEVNHPPHYGGDVTYETIKVLRAWNLEAAKWFCWGNAIKYHSRAGKKEGITELQDYEKAAWYSAELVDIQKEIDGG